MNPISMKIILFSFTVIQILMACQEIDNEKYDYRTKFTGDFNFTTIRTIVRVGFETSYDTIFYLGRVNKFLPGDDSIVFALRAPNFVNFDRMLAIKFINDGGITPEITEDGQLVEYIRTPYRHSGSYIEIDKLNFTVKDRSGPGGFTSYDVIGTRN